MTATKRVLYIGGTGQISAACVRRSLAIGHEVTVLNRGASDTRPLPDGVEVIQADVHDPAAIRAALGSREFDSVSEFVAFTTGHVAADAEFFAGRTGQYVFISSASAYQKPPTRIPVTESTPLKNPFWQYSRDKIAAEDLLMAAYRDSDFPVTIVRPSHTYDDTRLPTTGAWTDVARMRAGKPVVVHGDGSTQWTLTHVDDFAVAYAGLLGHPATIGEAYTITADHAPTWNQIYTWIAEAAGAEIEIVHATTAAIAAAHPASGDSLIGDKQHSMVFDCSKVKALVPEFQTTIGYDVGSKRVLAWFDAHPAAQVVDPELDAAFDRLVAHARAI